MHGTRFVLKTLFLKALSLLTVALCCMQQGAIAADGHWVTSWGCAPQLTEPGNLPPALLAHNTLRQFVRTSAGGRFLRARFSNAYGAGAITINSAHIALAAGAGSAANGEIDPGTDTPLRFRGAPTVVVPPGAVVYSDQVEFNLSAVDDVAVSIHFGEISSTSISGHPGSRTTSFIKSGNTVSDTTMAGATRTAHWYIISGMEVLADMSGQTAVAFGDSITDGRGSTTDGNDRWPDFFARRLNANGVTAGVGVANMGIGGNGLFGGLGPKGQDRFKRDVLDQNGVKWVILFIGVNDIGGASGAGSATMAQNIINAYTDFANQAHARNVMVYGATITPFGGGSYYTTEHEAARQTVNNWIRTNTVYDAFIDFDAAVRDPAAPLNLLPAYNSDGLHLNPAGYEAMAEVIDLNLFGP